MGRHVFHTRHDFVPEFAWDAFQILSRVGAEGLTTEQFRQIAHAAASPLSKRADPYKVLASMHDLGLADRHQEHHFLTRAGRLLDEGGGGYSEHTFHAAVHCLYIWSWLWGDRPERASPSWSYRTVCGEILRAGAHGVTQDELVLRVVEAAGGFQAEKVSFSRSSVHGVAVWLEAQKPALIRRREGRLSAELDGGVGATALQFHLAALCAWRGNRLVLDLPNVQLLAESWLIPRAEVIPVIEATTDFTGCRLVPSVPPQILMPPFRPPSLEWVFAACEQCRQSPATVSP